MSKIPLGQATEYPQEYAPELLFAIPRADARAALGLGPELPFAGVDTWNAWELTWLDADGKPAVATASMTVDANSTNIVESKSLKLYLGSLAMTRFDSVVEVVRTIGSDLAEITGLPVEVSIATDIGERDRTIDVPPGENIDAELMTQMSEHVDPGLLRAGDESVSETLHTHLLRSLCPVTAQPDIGSLMIRYSGPAIDRSSLLDYIVSFRQHEDFHEACVERMFLDIKNQCRPDELTVYACYNRRGGIDINPFRTDFDDEPKNLRLWRQ